MKNLSLAGIALIFILSALTIVFWPFVLIFALNTLFITLSIPYTFWTWLSITILQLSTFGGLATILRRIEKNL